jgi:hypothetical protein
VEVVYIIMVSLKVEVVRVPGENHRQPWPHNAVSITTCSW